MKKKRITYAVKDMMEYQAIIKIGRNNMPIPFSDGAMAATGNKPATFTTDNFIVQRAIENSADFKRGRITVDRVITLDEELPIVRNSAKPNAGPTPEPTPSPAPEKSGHPTIEDDGMAKENINPIDKEDKEDNQTEDDGNPAETKAEENPTSTQVEFTCVDDARDYLEQTFGCKRSKLRTKADIIAAGKANGVEIFFV